MSILYGKPANATGGPAGNSTAIPDPRGIILDDKGNIFIGDNTNGRIYRIDTNGVIEAFAAVSGSGMAIAADPEKGTQYLFVASNGSHIINRYAVDFDTKGGTVPATATLIAGESGNGRCCSDLQKATDAVLNTPTGVALDKAGNVYIADNGNNRIRWIANTNNCVFNAPTTCIIRTLAGPGGTSVTGAGTPSLGTKNQSDVGTNTVGDGGLAALARVNGPFGIAVTPDGSTLYFSETGDQRIRKIDLATGRISTVIGACLNTTVSNQASSTIVTGGIETTNPSTGSNASISGRAIVVPCASGSFGNATTNNTTQATSTLYDGQVGTSATVNNPRGLFLDNSNKKLYFADSSNNRIRVIDLNTGVVMTVIGSGSNSQTSANARDGASWNTLNIDTPYGVFVADDGRIFFIEEGSGKVRVADPTSNTTSTLVGATPATQLPLGIPNSLTTAGAPRVGVDAAGNVYVSETSTNKVRKIDPKGIITDFAGNGSVVTPRKDPLTGVVLDGGPAAAASLNNPGCIAFDNAGNAYIADTGNNLIRKVDAAGNITTVAGRLKVTASTSTLQGCTVAQQTQGTCSVDPSGNYYGDGRLATRALLNAPQCVDVDTAGNLYIADTGNNAIRKVSADTGIIDTIAGGVSAHIPGGPSDGRSGLGSSGNSEEVNALYATFNLPRGIAVDDKGNVYVADYNNSSVRELVPASGGYNSTVILGHTSSSNNDGITPNGSTATATPNNPIRTRIGSGGFDSIAVDSNGNIYMTDTGNSKILLEDAAHTKVYQIAGGASQNCSLPTSNCDNTTTYTAPATGNVTMNTQVPGATGVTVASDFTVYVVDRTGVVRKLVPPKTGFPAH